VLSYQDFLKAIEEGTKKEELILSAIEEYQESETYERAAMAQKYYARENVAILQRMNYLQRRGQVNSKIVFHKLCSGFFPKFCKQIAQYLLGNGITLNDAIKKRLGPRFDKDLQTMGINTLVDGVNWGFWNVNRLIHFRATEFFTLLDERTSIPMVGIRFWQLDEDKPLNVELYEVEGMTQYITDENDELIIMPDTKLIRYKSRIYSDCLTTQVLSENSYEVLPIFPLYANELKKSEFTDGLKSMIDAYDFIASDLADGITITEGIYWAVKNFGGEDAKQLVAEIENWRVTVDQNDATAQMFDVEIPFNAKQYALKLLEDSMYNDCMVLNLKSIQGGGLTNVAINVAKTDFDLKTDIFEWQVADFVQNILSLIGLPEVEVKFKRRTITNDTETVNNISTMLSDGYIDREMAIQLCPLITDADQAPLLKRIELEAIGAPNEPPDDDPISGLDDIRNILQLTGGNK